MKNKTKDKVAVKTDNEREPLKGVDATWRYSSTLVILRLFITTVNAVPNVTTAILPDLLDKLYQRHYACANASHVTGNGSTFQNAGASFHLLRGNETTFQDGVLRKNGSTSLDCTYPTKAIIMGTFIAYVPMSELFITFTVPYVIQKLGIRWTCIISVIVQMIGSLGTGFVTSLWMLFITRYLHGFCLFSVVACFAAVGRVFDNEHDRRQGVTMGLQGFLVGNFVSYFLGTLVYDYCGLLPTYILTSSFLFVELIICIIVKDPEISMDYPKNYSIYFKNVDVVLAGLYGIAGWAMNAAWQAIFPEWLYLLGARAFHIGTILTVSTLVQTLISLAYSKIRMSNHWFALLIPLSIAIPGFLLMPSTSHIYWLSILPNIVLLTSYCCVGAIVSTTLTEWTEDNPLLNYNMFLLIANIGTTIGGYGGGGLAQVLGGNSTFLIIGATAAFLTLTIIVKILYDRRKLKSRKSHQEENEVQPIALQILKREEQEE